MTEIRTERVKPHDAELAVTCAGDDGPLVVLIHGFPELAYSWRHQLTAMAEAGYRVIAPDMRGYGASDAPEEIERYDIVHLAGDVAGLIEHYGGGPALVVGHDWGAMVAWQFALFRPDLLAGVVGMSVPFSPPFGASIPAMLAERMGEDDFHYILYFQEPGVAEAELDADPIHTMRSLLWGASGEAAKQRAQGSGAGAEPLGTAQTGFLPNAPVTDMPTWLGEGDLNAYSQAFARSGFAGGINWYRNLDRNWELTRPWRNAKLTVPAAFVGGRLDPVLTVSGDLDGDHMMMTVQSMFAPDLEVVLVDDAGHWVQQEQPGAVNTALLSFAKRVLPAS